MRYPWNRQRNEVSNRDSERLLNEVKTEFIAGNVGRGYGEL